MEVEAGNENMKFEAGPFSYYGVMALTSPCLGEYLFITLLFELLLSLIEECNIFPLTGLVRPKNENSVIIYSIVCL